MDAQSLRTSLLHCIPVPTVASCHTLTSVLLDPPVTNTSHFRDGELMGQGDTSGGGAARSPSSSHQFQILAFGLLLPDPTTPEMLRKAKSLSNKYYQCGVLLLSSKELGFS